MPLSSAAPSRPRWADTKRADSAAIESRYTKIPIDIVNEMARNMFATSLDAKLIDPTGDGNDSLGDAGGRGAPRPLARRPVKNMIAG
jgi:hypothetical protein